MIKTLRHKGLKRFLETGSAKGINAQHAARIRRILTALQSATCERDVAMLPGMQAHPLKGERAGTWAVSVSGNWRITFRFAEGHIHEVDLEDYH